MWVQNLSFKIRIPIFFVELLLKSFEDMDNPVAKLDALGKKHLQLVRQLKLKLRLTASYRHLRFQNNFQPIKALPYKDMLVSL